MTSSYVIALGSNRRGRHGRPADEVRAALAAIGGVVMTSPLVSTAPLGPARRRFVNAAALIESDDSPPELLARLKAIESAFGRRRGQRWTDRVIDLDIILWSGGAWASDGLTVPHPDFRRRDFVLGPVAAIVPDWRDPMTGLTMRQLGARLR
ncbi:2-amino-4-hydroxy-6-hydroxymethyldihydropteridine diphosphokinase [Sphingomonas asaccharolytica]|uniref:2-amino-4-hydroxy-6- hydroxymethyldihydropteridine diphosphokinase n=1 Tax=Sphingomonas asaccharolytica TaxID=40681 RepID=UPI0008324702|nr:2-amino-4-hydroxy-6-hydroxymethyldihydropteridine diphosphokinase [Sphingomonas asaccharolytica]